MLKYNELKENFEYPDAKLVNFNDKEFFIKQFLPSDKKYSLISFCANMLSLKEQFYNPFLAEIIFDVEIVKEYSNIVFENIEDSYFYQFDVLENMQIIDLVIENIPQKEYEELQRLYYELIENQVKYYNNISQGLRSFLKQIPDDIDFINDSLQPEKMQKGIKMIQQLATEQHI